MWIRTTIAVRQADSGPTDPWLGQPRLQGSQKGASAGRSSFAPSSAERLRKRCSWRRQIINSLAKGRPADAALLAAGIRPQTLTPTPTSEPQLIPPETASGHQNDAETNLQAHKAAFFFKLERELERVRQTGYSRGSGRTRLILRLNGRSMLSTCKRKPISRSGCDR